MSQSTFSYSLYEGTFLSQQPILDRSIQILMFRDQEQQEYQIIINRASLAEEEDMEEWCDKEMDNLRNKLPGFTTEGKKIKSEIGPAKLKVLQVANHYLQEGNIVRQVQSMIQLPQHPRYNPLDRELLIFTLNSEQPFSEQQRQHYIQIINSFAPDIITA